MEQDLENARFDEIEEVGGHKSQFYFASELTSSHTQPRANISHIYLRFRSTRRSDLESPPKHEFVGEWVRKSSEQHQTSGHCQEGEVKHYE